MVAGNIDTFITSDIDALNLNIMEHKHCLEGSVYNGNPQGAMETIGGMECYVSHNASHTQEKCVLLLSDVFGNTFINTQLMADAFARAGYFVVAPDLFRGEPLVMGSSKNLPFPEFFAKHTPEYITPALFNLARELKTKHGVKHLGAVGYCFGARFVILLSGQAGVLQAGCMAHPTNVVVNEVSQVKAPLSFACAEVDDLFVPELKQKSREVLNEIGIANEFIDYPQTVHGFAVRGDPNNPIVDKARDKAFSQHVNWFKSYL